MLKLSQITALVLGLSIISVQKLVLADNSVQIFGNFLTKVSEDKSLLESYRKYIPAYRKFDNNHYKNKETDDSIVFWMAFFCDRYQHGNSTDEQKKFIKDFTEIGQTDSKLSSETSEFLKTELSFSKHNVCTAYRND